MGVSQLVGRVLSGACEGLIQFSEKIGVHPYGLVGLFNLPLLIMVFFMPGEYKRPTKPSGDILS